MDNVHIATNMDRVVKYVWSVPLPWGLNWETVLPVTAVVPYGRNASTVPKVGCMFPFTLVNVSVVGVFHWDLLVRDANFALREILFWRIKQTDKGWRDAESFLVEN